MNNWERYPLERSLFFRMGRRSELLKRLKMKQSFVTDVIENPDKHYFTKTEEVNGKVRDIQLPVRRLRRVHEHIKSLLERIEMPPCIMSPKGGVTIKENVEPHKKNSVVQTFDVKQFYPSTTHRHVYDFFLIKCEMRPELAGLMAKLTTYKGKLPFGSPLSPILCAHVHAELFETIQSIADDKKLSVSAWVDDVTVSGNGAFSGSVFEMRKAVAAKGLKTHKASTQKTRNGAVITGASLKQGHVGPGNGVHLKIRDRLNRLDVTSDPTERTSLLNSLIGLHTHCLQMYDEGSAQHDAALKRKQWLCEQRRQLHQVSS